MNNSVHLGLFALRDIKVGEELRYDYNASGLPWRTKKKTCDQRTLNSGCGGVQTEQYTQAEISEHEDCENSDHPSDCKDSNHPSDCKDSDPPSDCKDSDHPSDCKDSDHPSDCKDSDHPSDFNPSDCKYSNHPSDCKDSDHPSDCKDSDHPSDCNPSDCKDSDHPSDCNPSDCKDSNHPSDCKDSDHPSDCKDSDHPSDCNPSDCKDSDHPSDCNPSDCKDSDHPSDCKDSDHPSDCNPSDCKGSNHPSDCKDSDHPSDCKDSDHPPDCNPSDCKDSDHPSDCKDSDHPSDCNPSDCKDSDHPSDCKDSDHPSDCKDSDHPSDCNPSDCKDSNHPSDCKDSDHPSDCKDSDHPSDCNPSDCKDSDHPSDCKDSDHPSDCNPSDCKDSYHPSDCKDSNHPSDCKDSDHPSDCKDSDHPSDCNPSDCKDSDHLSDCKDSYHPSDCNPSDCKDSDHPSDCEDSDHTSDPDYIVDESDSNHSEILDVIHVPLTRTNDVVSCSEASRVGSESRRSALPRNDDTSQIGSESHLPQSSGKIQVLQTNNLQKRHWDKGAFCPFCQSYQKKLPRHLRKYKAHQNEPDVIQWLATSDKDLKAKRLTRMRNLGNHIHNVKVLKEGQGTIIPVYRPDHNAEYTNYLPCVDCYGYYVKFDLWKHNCLFRESDGKQTQKKKRQFVKESKLLLPIPGASKKAQEILAGLRYDDGVARFIRSDKLMKDLTDGLALSHGHDSDNFAYIRNKLRELGRLCLTYREMTGNPNAALSDLIDPSRFSDVVKATRKTAGFDEETNLYTTPSLALKIGHSLKAAAEVLLSQALSDGPTVDDALEDKCQRFLRLYNIKWSRSVSSNALRTLTENKRNNPQYLPVTSDIAKLAKYLKQEMKTGVQALSQGDPDPLVWRSLSEATLTSILLFNRKRSGEVSKLKVHDFENSQKGESSVIDGLSEWEKTLCKTMTRIEIVGKRGRTVPVILTTDMLETMKVLMKSRMEVGVPEDNKFFFALLHSQSHLRGSDTLRDYANKCGATKPNLLRSTRLRKHIGTVSQIINLRDNELDILANFLGHDIRVHRQFYRLPEETVQLAKVSKILLNMDKGTTSHLAGRTLDELSIEQEGEILNSCWLHSL